MVGEGGGDIAIGEDEFAAAERGEDALLDEFGARGHVQEHLAADGHFQTLIGLGEDDVLADALADGCAAGLTNLEVLHALRLAEIGELAELRGLAGAVGAFENDEATGVGADEGGVGRWSEGWGHVRQWAVGSGQWAVGSGQWGAECSDWDGRVAQMWMTGTLVAASRAGEPPVPPNTGW